MCEMLDGVQSCSCVEGCGCLNRRVRLTGHCLTDWLFGVMLSHCLTSYDFCTDMH